MSQKTTQALFAPLPRRDQELLGQLTRTLFERELVGDPDRRAEALDHLAHFSAGVVFSDLQEPIELTSVRTRLNGHLGTSPFPALLLQPRGTGSAGALVAWVLAAALARLREDPAEHAIAAALRDTRLLIAGPSEALTFLDPVPATLAGLARHLRDVEESGDLPAALNRRLPSIRYLLDVWHRARPPIFRRPGEEERPIRLLPAAAAGIADFAGGFITLPASAAGAPEEQEAEATVGGDTTIVAERLTDLAPAPVLRQRSGRIARAAALRALALPAEHDPMTAHEIAILLHRLVQVPAPPGAAELLASLVFGLPVEVLAASPDSGRCAVQTDAGPGQPAQGLWLRHRLPEPDLIEALQQRAPDEALFLPTPAELPDLAGLRGDAPLQDVLAVLRPCLARPMTPGRIARFKSDWLRRAGADAAVIGFLTAADPARRAQMHYTSAAQADLLSWHRRYVEDALGLTLPEHPMPDPNRQYGSGIRLGDEILRALFEEQRARLRRLATGPVAPLSQIAAAHNAFTLYTLILLYLATGHRPVSHPFEMLGDCDLDTGLLWISDKHTGQGSRITMLPPTAQGQLAAFRDHLGRLAGMLSLPAPDVVARHIRPAMATGGADAGVLFFFLDDAGQVRDMSWKAQIEAVADVWPIQLNWTRHMLRSHLLQARALPQAIDAMFGHGHLGEAPFAAGSGLSISELRTLSTQVETALQNWHATVAASPLRIA